MTIRPIDIADPAAALRVLALQRLSYSLEADLLGRDDMPPLQESVEDLRACGETFLGRFAADTLCGAIAYRVIDGTLDLHRVMVHPHFLRRGIASSLIAFVEAQEARARRTLVATGSGNTPARRLYARLGFRETGEREVAPGLWIVAFEKPRP
jgi:ribosomal protein S18 acetylase RimI-like enzyme